MIYAYPCVLTPAEDGSLIATFPDVPEAITGGADRSEALARAEDALAAALAGYVHEKWDVPVPSEAAAGQEVVAVPTVVAAKLALYAAMRAQRITNVELARRWGSASQLCASWSIRTIAPTSAMSRKRSGPWDAASESRSPLPEMNRTWLR